MSVENGWLIVLAHPVSSTHPILLIIRGYIKLYLYYSIKPIYISPRYEVPHYYGVYGCVMIFRVDYSPSG